MKKTTIPNFSSDEYLRVLNKLNPQNSKACNNNLLWNNSSSNTFSGIFKGFSFKRSNLKYARFENAVFDHCNFTGSLFESVVFNSNTNLTSVNFLRSKFNKCEFKSNEVQHAMNFSSCIIENCVYNGNTIRGSYFNNSKIYNTKFINQKIISTSFDNCYFKDVIFDKCNIKNLNLEFATFDNVSLIDTQISFYQLPYIIGIFSEINNLKNLILGCGKGKTITFEEYCDNIQDSITYFTYLNQYLPLANLYYLKKDYENAKNSILIGIDFALIKQDFTNIKYLIRMGAIYNLLTYSEIQSILKSIDQQLSNLCEDENYKYYIMQSYEIQSDLNNILNKAVLDIKIETTLNNNQFDSASEICQEIDELLMSLNLNTEHSFRLSHNSPITIVLSVIGLSADLISISALVYNLISKKFNKNKTVNIKKQMKLAERLNDSFLNEIGDDVDMLKIILSKSPKAEHEEIITNFRSKLLTKLGDKIDTDILLYSTEEIDD